MVDSPSKPQFTLIRGFTLIELVIAVAIMGILAAIALPSYTEFLRRGWRGECKAAVMSVLQAQERAFTANSTYSADLTAIGASAFSGDNANGSSCTLAAAPCNGSDLRQCVLVTATSRKGDLACEVISRTSAGTRGGTNVALCWAS